MALSSFNMTKYTNGTNLPLGNVSGSPGHPFGPLAVFTEFWIAYYLNQYYPWCLCGAGVLCNMAVFIITIIIKPFNTSSLYVATLSVVDSLALIIKLLYTVLTAYDVPMGQTGCQLIMFVGYFIVQFSVWILAIITLERFIAVHLVFRVASLFTMTRARLSLVVTALILLTVDANIFWTTTEISDPVTGLQCGIHPEHSFFATKVWHWIDATLAFFGPCSVLLILNSLILVKLRRHRAKTRACFEGKQDKSTRDRQQNRQLTVMLITMSVGTTCLLLPISVFYIIRANWNYQASPYSMAVFLLVTNIVHFLADCSHAMNFVFCILGGHRFRGALRSYLCHRGNQTKGKDRTLSVSHFNTLSKKSTDVTSISYINTHL